MIIEELVARLGWDLTGEQDLRKFKQGMTDAERSLSAFASRMATFAAAAATAFGAAMGGLGKSVINVSAEFEKMEATLTTIEGSSEKAKKSLSWVADFAKKTPFDLQQVNEAFVRLRSYGLDPMDGTLTAVGDAASAMGKGLMQGVEAVADAANGEFERLKEFGITSKTVGDNVTFYWSRNGQQMSRTVKKTSTEITKFLRENMGERFNGAMLRQSKTWDGMMSNLGDSWTDFQKRIGDGGFFETVKGHLGGLLDYIGRLDADGTLDRWSKTLGDSLTWGVDQAIFAISRLTRHFNAISDWVSANPDMFEKIKTGLIVIGAVMFPKLSAIMVLEELLTYLEGGQSVIGDFAKSLSELTGIDAGKIGAVLAAIAGGGAGLLLAWPAIRGTASAIRSLAGALGLLGGKTAADGLGNLAKAGGKGAGLRGLAFLGGAGAAVYGTAWAGLMEMIDQTKSGQTAYSKGNAIIPGPEDALAWLYRQMNNSTNPYASQANAARKDQAGFNVFQGVEDRLNNYNRNVGKMDASNTGAAVSNTVNDSSDRSVSVVVHQTVQQATQAPAAVANAVGNAAAGAVQGPPMPPSRTFGGGYQ